MKRYSFTAKGVYDYADIEHHNDYTPIYTLFLDESSLSINEKMLTRGTNGGYFYKPLKTHIFRVYTNKQEEKYLRGFHKTGKGLVFESRSEDLRLSNFLYEYKINRRESSLYCKEMVALIEGHISKLMGYSFTYKPCPKIDDMFWVEDDENWMNSPEALCFPFLRDSENRKFVRPLLKENKAAEADRRVAEMQNLSWTGKRGLNTALRNAKNKEEFIKWMVYKSALQSEDDLKCLMSTPSLVRVFSKFNLKMGASEAEILGYAEPFHKASNYMKATELSGFKFLLSNLPKTKTIEVLKLALRLATFRKEQEDNGVIDDLQRLIKTQENSYVPPLQGISYELEKYLKLIPVFDRQEFAILFLEEFRREYLLTEETYTSVARNEEELCDGHKCFIKVMGAFMQAYSKKYYQSLPLDSVGRCISSAIELFGTDIRNYEALKSGTVFVPDLNIRAEYFDFREQHTNKDDQQSGTDLFHLLRTSVDVGFVWSEVFTNPSHNIWRSYLNMKKPNKLMLASELEEVLIKIAGMIDLSLLKLGQALTPANRMTFLAVSSQSSRRQYKGDWRYYLLGVSPEDLPFYKQAGIRSKKDILFWVETKNSLPPEMYQELLNVSADGASNKDVMILDF